MITDARALETTDVPQDLEHRDGQFAQLATALEPIADGLGGDQSLIFGPSGSGKTTLAKYVVRKLRQEAFDVRRTYWNCTAGSAKNEVLHGLAQDSAIGNHPSRTEPVPADSTRRSARSTNTSLRSSTSPIVSVTAVYDRISSTAQGGYLSAGESSI